MSKHRATGWRLDPRLAGLGALAALLAGLGYLISAQPGKAPGARLIVPSSRATIQPAAGTPAAGTPSTESAATGSATATDPLAAALRSPASRPVQIRVPAIGVDSSLQPLGLLPDGSLQAPSQPRQAGWYAGGVPPGAVGPAVIAGQLDPATAVFHRLSELRPGAEVLIRRRDGQVLRFRVYDVRAYPKRGFPSAAVYGPAATPVLRLITSTGGFDEQAQGQRDSLVVSARLTGG